MLDKTSLARLKGVHADLVEVAKHAHQLATEKGLQFRITEGLRTIETQREYVKRGASRTMNSRHLTGHAFDFVPIVAGKVNWKWPAFWPLVEVFELAAYELGVEIECGARWTKFADGPHIELSRKVYP
jgi:peptidoglycan LD-endopeptidase CwlK